MKKTNVLVINTLTIKIEINNHFNNGCNAQVFNGSISGCVFAMPGSNVTQQAPLPPAKPPAAEGNVPEVG